MRENLDIHKIKRKVVEDQIKRSLLLKEQEKDQTDLLDLEKRLDSFTKARVILQDIIESARKNIADIFNNLVSMALSAVFPDPYAFEMEFVLRRNKWEADIFLVKNGQKIEPMHSSGGGVLDIISFACRIVFYVLKPGRPFMALDEPMRHLSADYHEAASDMIKMLSDKIGIQFLIVTHLRGLMESADKVFNLEEL